MIREIECISDVLLLAEEDTSVVVEMHGAISAHRRRLLCGPATWRGSRQLFDDALKCIRRNLRLSNKDNFSFQLSRRLDFARFCDCDTLPDRCQSHFGEGDALVYLASVEEVAKAVRSTISCGKGFDPGI